MLTYICILTNLSLKYASRQSTVVHLKFKYLVIKFWELNEDNVFQMSKIYY